MARTIHDWLAAAEAIAFTPEGKQYRVAGVTATGALIEAAISTSYHCGVPKGTRDRVELRFAGIAA
jgi:hypothetical protein